MALQLRRRGIVRVRPLEGGLAAWRARGYRVYDTRGEGGPAATGIILK